MINYKVKVFDNQETWSLVFVIDIIITTLDIGCRVNPSFPYEKLRA